MFTCLLEIDPAAAQRARVKIAKGMKLLEEFPFTCRKARPDMPRLRELVIDYGHAGYVVLFDIDDASTVTTLAVRHQREDDFF